MGILSRISEAKEMFYKKRELSRKTRLIQDKLDLEAAKQDRVKLEESANVKREIRKEKQKIRDIKLAPVKNTLINIRKGLRSIKEAADKQNNSVTTNSTFDIGSEKKDNPFIPKGKSPFG